MVLQLTRMKRRSVKRYIEFVDRHCCPKDFNAQKRPLLISSFIKIRNINNMYIMLIYCRCSLLMQCSWIASLEMKTMTILMSRVNRTSKSFLFIIWVRRRQNVFSRCVTKMLIQRATARSVTYLFHFSMNLEFRRRIYPSLRTYRDYVYWSWKNDDSSDEYIFNYCYYYC